MRCKYCYESHYDRKTSIDIAKGVVNFLVSGAKKSGHIPRLSFFGGEPLLYFDDLMRPTIEYMKDRSCGRYSMSFVTNGLLLDEEKLRYFKENNINFMFSIDGCEQAHNANRIYADGHGTFADVEKKIPLILKYFPMTTFRMTLTPASVPYLYQSVIYAAHCGFIDMHIVPNVFEQWEEKDYEELGRQMQMIGAYIINTFEDNEVPLVFTILGQMFPRMVVNQYEKEHDRYRESPSTLPCNRCGLGILGKAEIDTDGNLFGCFHAGMEPNISNPLFIGNIYDGLIESQVERLLAMNEAYPLWNKECKECSLDRICTGGCVPNNLAITGDFNHPPDIYCKWSQIVYRTAEAIVEHFDAKKDNELFKYFFYGQVNRGVCAVC